MAIVPIEIPEEMFCRICFETDSTIINPLIRPCLCNGTSRHVHKSCIQRWREMNRDNISFDRCNECHHYYDVDESYENETYKISSFVLKTLQTFSAYGSFCLMSLYTGFALRSIDKHTGFPTLYIITNFEKPSNEMIDYFTQNELYNIQYLFCFVVLCFSGLFNIHYILYTTYKIKRKTYFWSFMAIPYALNLVMTNHLYYYGRICNNRIKMIEGLLILECTISSFNLLIMYWLFVCHNRIIKIMNSDTLGEIYSI